MFAMEMSTRWRQELTWRCFLACAITIVVVRTCVTTCVSHGQCANLKWGSLIWFQVSVRCPAHPPCSFHRFPTATLMCSRLPRGLL